MTARTDARKSLDEVKQEILHRLDVRAEYERHGWKFRPGAAVRSNDCIACFAIGREDNNASAFIDVVTGVYSDSGGTGGKTSWSFWDAMVEFGGHTDFNAALEHFADAAGVQMPAKSKQRKGAIDLLDVHGNLIWFSCRGLLKRYPLMSLPDLLLSGAQIGWYGADPWKTCVVAIPFFDPTLAAEKPRGWVIQPADGRNLRHGTDEAPSVSKRISVGTPSGFLNPVALRAIKAKTAKLVIKTEGVSDWAALMWICPDEVKASGEVAITTNSSGATESDRPKEFGATLIGTRFVVVHDADQPGQKGAQKWIDAAQGTAESIRNAQLGYEIAEKHGKDLRNWISEQLAGRTRGQVWQLFLDLIEASPELAKPVEVRPSGIYPVSHPMGRTEIQNGKRIVAKHGRNLLYCHPWKSALLWDGKRWKVDQDNAVAELAKDISRDIWTDVAKAPEGEEDEVTDFAKSSSKLAGVTAMLKLAYSEPGITVQPSELDQNNWLLNCQNGTLNLKTGELQPFDPSDRITKLCPTEYDPDAESEVWTQFIESILPDDDVVQFIQRFLGMCLTGDVSAQVLPIFWGGGSNGKSTLWNAVVEVMGDDFAIKADNKLLVEQPNGGHTTELMDLFGRRLAIASETKEGEKLAESMVKSLTGGDRIRGRRMRENTWEYTPTHKIILCTNHRPDISGTDDGIWRRIRLVPFTEQFHDAKDPKGPKIKDPDLPAKLLAARPAILAWLVRGCLEWQKSGLPNPEPIRAAVSEYRSDQDMLAAFVNERCRQVSGSQERSSDLYEQYIHWAKENGEPAISHTKFGLRMKLKFKAEKHGVVWFKGIMIEPQWKEQLSKGGRKGQRRPDGDDDLSDDHQGEGSDNAFFT